IRWRDGRLARPTGRGRPVLPQQAVSALVRTRLLRRQIAGVFDSIQIQPAGRKLGDLSSAPRWEFHLETLGPDQAPNGALVHGEEVAAHPVPALEVVCIVNADHNLQLGLSPEAGAVWRRQSDSGIEVGQLELAVIAIQIHSGLVLRVFAKIIVRLDFKAHFFRAGHLVGGVKLQPLSAGADAVRFALIRSHGATLGAGPCRCANQKGQKNGSRRQPETDCLTKQARYFQDLLLTITLLHTIEPGNSRKVVWKGAKSFAGDARSEEHTSELQSPCNLVCRLL